MNIYCLESNYESVLFLDTLYDQIWTEIAFSPPFDDYSLNYKL